MSDDELLQELLQKPVGPALSPKATDSYDFTTRVEVSGSSATVVANLPEGEVDDGTGTKFLREEGLDPREWEQTGFRKVKYGNVDKPMESVTFSYKKRSAGREPIPLDELFKSIDSHKPVAVRPSGPFGAVFGLGDNQFGKIDGDGPAGTLARTISVINSAADAIIAYRQWYDIGHIHVTWLGDHIEGFVSQGGANTWRTQLTLNEQIRLTRRVMMHAVDTFAPLAERVSFAALPGNHGEPQRFMGTGVTRYDDSHDTESLIAIADAIERWGGDKFSHVDFYVPDTDELVVVTDVAGTRVAQTHGNFFRPGKHFDWWRGQSFNPASAMRDADALWAGHLHHKHIDTWADKHYIGVPALESESTWYRHRTGVPGAPGGLLGITKDGLWPVLHEIR